MALWQQRGKAYAWRYTTRAGQFPGWHFTSDDSACDSLIELLRIMQAGVKPAATIALTKPTPRILAVPNNVGARVASAEVLKLEFDPTADAARIDLAFSEKTLTLRLMRDTRALAQGLSDIRAGKGDYSIGAGETRLWFWWTIRTTS